MKIDLKLVFLSLVVFGLVCETAGWWRGGSRRSSGSRSTPSSSRRSWGWGSRRRSSPSPPPSSSRRRSWGWRSRRRSSPSPSSSRRRSWGWRSRRRSSPSPPPSSSRRRSWGWRSRRRSSPSPSSSRRRFWGWGSRRRGTSSSTSSSLTKGKIAYPHDIKTKSGLRKLFNSRVTSIKHVERPMSGSKKIINTGIPNHHWKHTGVVVTTANGKKYLIHKGKGYGKSSQPVVVDAKHMSSKWRVTAGRGTKPVNGYKIKDFVSKGGKGYSFIGNNCQHASGRMYKQGDDKLGKRNSCSG